MRGPFHVCILTTIHPADDVRVYEKMACSFLAAGFKVSWVGPEYVFFDWSAITDSSVQYHFFPTPRSKRERIMAWRSLLQVGRTIPDVDVYFAPDPDSAMVALWLARGNHARVIFDIHEFYHRTLILNYVRGSLRSAVGILLKWMISLISRSCNLTIGVSETVLNTYIRDRKKSFVVRNCAPAWFAELPVAARGKSEREPFIIMHGKAAYFPEAPEFGRGTELVLAALRVLKDKIPLLCCIMFDTFRGEAERDWFKQYVQDAGLQEIIDLRPGIPMRQMPQVLQACDVGLIAYRRGMEGGTLANRVFEYMGAGLPTIAPSYSPETVRVIRDEKCGVAVDFEDADAVANAILDLYLDEPLRLEMGQRARDAFLKRHNWDVEVQPLLDWIHQAR